MHRCWPRLTTGSKREGGDTGSPHSYDVRVRKVLGVGAVAVVAVVAFALLNFRLDWAPSLNPFREEETVDNTGPSVLKAVTDLSEFRAARGYYETVVELEEGGLSLVPNFLDGEKVLYVGKGTVDAYVDFSDLDEDRITLSPDGTSAEIDLPAPQLAEPNLDVEASQVYDRDSGFIQRFQDSDLEQDAQVRAVEQMTTAANGESDLLGRAEANTTSTLETLLGALGYDDVTVTFDPDPR